MISGRKQEQQAGDNSNQWQVTGDVTVIQGISEERAREIARVTASEAVERYATEAQAVAAERIDAFDGAMIERLARINALGYMADPAFLVTVRKAQIGAASTERQDDYDILAALLEDRANRIDERPVRASVNRAVEVVDQLDTDALRGLTVLQAVVSYSPSRGSLDNSLDLLENLLRQLVDGPLPYGREWMDHLDVLHAARASSSDTFIEFGEFWSSKAPGLISVGLPDGAEEIEHGRDALLALNVRMPVIPHELKPGYVRFPAVSEEGLRGVLSEIGVEGDRKEGTVALAKGQFRAFERDLDLIPLYLEKVDLRPTLRAVHEWWAQLPKHLALTPVGSVLAKANANRLDKARLLPPLD